MAFLAEHGAMAISDFGYLKLSGPFGLLQLDDCTLSLKDNALLQMVFMMLSALFKLTSLALQTEGAATYVDGAVKLNDYSNWNISSNSQAVIDGSTFQRLSLLLLCHFL